MEAAAHGKSTLGIPKKVGQDFARADGDRSFAAGGFVSTGVAPPSTMGTASPYPAPPQNVPIGNPQNRPTVGKRMYSKKGM